MDGRVVSVYPIEFRQTKLCVDGFSGFLLGTILLLDCEIESKASRAAAAALVKLKSQSNAI